MPEQGVTPLSHDELLSYQELERICLIFTQLGINKIRITGGEPLARKNCVDFMSRLMTNIPGLDLRLTTNGVALLPHLKTLNKIGIKKINLSLDTLSKERFISITRRDKYDSVLASFNEALRQGFDLKVNSVIQPRTTDSEIYSIAGLARDNRISLRFIELMPFSGSEERFFADEELLESRLRRLFPGMRETFLNAGGTARIFKVPGYCGSLGIIEGESRKFCSSCNKVRITPAGLMKNCLYDNGVLDIRNFIRQGRNNEELEHMIAAAIGTKLSDGHRTAAENGAPGQQITSMASIGG